MINSGRYPEGAYNDGYDTGLNWKENYTPGGPWHFSKGYTGSRNPEETKVLVALYEREYHEWHVGFADGLQAQNPQKFVAIETSLSKCDWGKICTHSTEHAFCAVRGN